ncbi:MAG: murein hydrolase activator EnvC family protein [Gammaproteobacteria bacterium]
MLITSAWGADETAQEQTRKLKEIQRRIQSLDKDLKSDQGRAEDLSGRLREIENRLAGIYSQIRSTEKRQKQVEAKRAKLIAERGELDEKLAASSRQLAGMLRSAYVAGRSPHLKLLLNQQSPEQVGRQLGYLRYVNRHRLETIQRIRGQLDRLAELDLELGEAETDLVQLIRDRRSEGERVSKDRSIRETLLRKLRQRISSKGDQLAKLRLDRDRLTDLVKNLEEALSDIPDKDAERQPIRSLRGRLPWPAAGKLVTRYGSRRGEDLRWKGVMIGAGAGAEVRAISHGRVAYADWLRGLGLLLIIDHGDGVMSLYGHNQSLYRQVGEWVNEGDLLATVGDSGGLDQPALYFEIRNQGKPVNPSRWCERPRHDRVG